MDFVLNGQAYGSVDITPATISMNPSRRSENDRPVFDLQNLPLPVIHKDFDINYRELAVSRNGTTPLDTTMAELAGVKVAEEAEKLVLGITDSYSFGGGTVYGYLNYPGRLTKVMTAPTAGGWSPSLTLLEVMQMKAQSVASKRYGPWKLYTSPDWDLYLDGDYSAATPTAATLRERLLKVSGISGIETLDYLTGFTMIMVQQTSDVVRLVIGMEVTTLQWQTNGGMDLHYKVMCIMVPQFRTDINGSTGVVVGTTA
jgi:hypothetical protein